MQCKEFVNLVYRYHNLPINKHALKSLGENSIPLIDSDMGLLASLLLILGSLQYITFV